MISLRQWEVAMLPDGAPFVSMVIGIDATEKITL